MLGPPSVPEVTDPAVAEEEVELAVLSAVAHGNGPNGLAVVQAALVALGRSPRARGGVLSDHLERVARAMRRALEALVMERQTEGNTTFPPFAQQIFERGLRDGKIDGLREALVRSSARAGLTLTEDDRARIQECDDVATLDRWIENVLGAKTTADVLL